MAGGLAGFADEVGEAYALVGVAEEMEVRRELGGEVGDAVLVAYSVLGKALGQRWRREKAGVGRGPRMFWSSEKARVAKNSSGCEGEGEGFGASEEGSEEALAGRDAVGELLVGEGGGEERGGSEAGTRKPKPLGRTKDSSKAKAARMAEEASRSRRPASAGWDGVRSRRGDVGGGGKDEVIVPGQGGEGPGWGC